MLKAIGILMMAVIAEPAAAQVWAPQAVQPSQATPPAQRPASGWVGITYSGNAEMDSEGNLVYSEYPVVVSVDPGSPAAKAGVTAGDTIVAFNDRDIRRFAFPMRTMIQPGKIFTIRSRNGKTEREYKVVVVERTDHREMVAITMRPTMPAMPNAPFVLVPAPSPQSRVRLTRATTMMTVLAGAEVRSLSVDLAKNLGIKPQGLFIVNVSEGSPAKEAGLKDGDVLLRAAEQNLLTPQDLQQILQMDINRSVKIELLRQKKAQTVILRW